MNSKKAGLRKKTYIRLIMEPQGQRNQWSLKAAIISYTRIKTCLTLISQCSQTMDFFYIRFCLLKSKHPQSQHRLRNLFHIVVHSCFKSICDMYVGGWRGGHRLTLVSSSNTLCFLKDLFSIYVNRCFCLHAGMHTRIVQCSKMIEEGIEYPETGVMDCCEAPGRFWKQSQGSL